MIRHNFVTNWLQTQKKINKLSVKKTSVNNLANWNYNDKEIYHKERNFFSIAAFKFEARNIKKSWSQPLIIQNEIGILGILKKKIQGNEYYLLQAKVEPGNLNGVQLSPTVQATKSNYLRKHKGKKTKYVNFFLKKNKNIKILKKKKLSEQGTKYLNKRNLNILIDLKNENIKKNRNYIWLKKDEIKYLLKKKNIINMDTISVFSSSIKKIPNNFKLISSKKLLNCLKKFKKRNELKRKKIFFSKMDNWIVNKKRIYDKKNKFFSIIFLDIKANSREVKKWSQPLLSNYRKSFIGLIVKKINNNIFYLLEITYDPGDTNAKFTTTINIKNFNNNKNYRSINYYNYFLNQKKLNKYVFSDEGGRFFKNETFNCIRMLNEKEPIKIKSNYYWVSHNQIIDLINKNLFSIEARNLFACFNIDNIK